MPGERTEVYNVHDDPSETCDLAATRPKKTAHLLTALNVWLKRTGAKLPVRNPDFDEKRWWTGGGDGAEGAK